MTIDPPNVVEAAAPRNSRWRTEDSWPAIDRVGDAFAAVTIEEAAPSDEGEFGPTKLDHLAWQFQKTPANIAGGAPAERASTDANNLLPSRRRSRNRLIFGISFAGALLAHVASFGLLSLIVLWMSADAGWRVQGIGLAAGDPSGASSNPAVEAGGPGSSALPDLRESAAAVSRVRDAALSDTEIDVEAAEFDKPLDKAAEQTDEKPALFGVGSSDWAPADALTRHHRSGPSALIGAAGAAASAAPAGRPGSSAASGPVGAGQGYVRARPAGAGGSGGDGGAANGVDGRGLPLPEYPVESQLRNETGRVVLQVEVRSDGRPGEIKVLSDAGFPRLARAAVAAVRKAKFIPASLDGRPVGELLTIPFDFLLTPLKR